MPGTISVTSTDIRLLNLETRLPFEFGIVRMTELPHCFVSIEADIDGTHTIGRAADHLPPKWLTKDPDLGLAEEADAMIEVVQRACILAGSIEGTTVFDCWQQLYEAQRDWAATTDYPPLLWNFGVAFIERALIDAFCRATGDTFQQAVRDNSLEIRPGYVYQELEGTDPATHLPERPAESITVRHTVGHGDPLRDADRADPNDDLPFTLTEHISTYDIDHFKLKIKGDVEADRQRIRDVVSLLEAECPEYAFTLDANEQYRDVEDLSALIDGLESDQGGTELRDRLLFVEQPFPRDIALSETTGEALAAWSERPPIIIDESDARLDSFGRALERGYAGTSYKNCKGVFKGLINACLADHRRAAGESLIISGEDLTTIGPVSLQQDLAAMATLGLDHVERNGHHYFRGLSMFDETIQSAVIGGHPDLYRTLPDGTPTLAIENGRLALESVNEASFGYDCDIDPSRFASPSEWSFVPLES